MKGITNRDVEHYNPRCNARGTIKKGTAVMFVTRGTWSAWVVRDHADAGFMSKFDWRYSFVDVPADAVDRMEDSHENQNQ